MPAAKTKKPLLQAIHVTIQNRPGALAKATRALADAGVNLEALEAEILGQSGFFRFYTDGAETAIRVLRSQGYVVVGMDVVEAVLTNKPGEVARMCDALAKANINIESCFGSAHGPNKECRMYLRVDRPAEALRILSSAQFEARRTTG